MGNEIAIATGAAVGGMAGGVKGAIIGASVATAGLAVVGVASGIMVIGGVTYRVVQSVLELVTPTPAPPEPENIPLEAIES